MCQAHSWSAARWWSGDSSFAIGIAQAALYYYCIHKQWLHSSVSGSGASRLAATCTCAVQCACSWLMTQTMAPLTHLLLSILPCPRKQLNMELKGKRFCRLFGGYWRRFRVSLIYGTSLFLSFLLNTIGIMVFIGRVDVIHLCWLFR